MRTMRWLLATGVAAAVGLGVASCQDGSPTGPPGGGGGGGGGGGITIGPAGGTVISSDGNFVLTIPAGALDAATTVTVTKVDASTLTSISASPLAVRPSLGASGITARAFTASGEAHAATTPLYIPGTGYKVEPQDLALKVAASVKIKYDATTLPSGYDPQLLRIRHHDRTQNQWRDCAHAGLQGGFVEASATSLATFAIYGWPPPPTGSAGALIDAAGGTVTSADGNFILTIPAGALEATTQVIVTKVDAAELTRLTSEPASLGALSAAGIGATNVTVARSLVATGSARTAMAPVYITGTGYKVEPENLALKLPASLQIRFDPATLPSGVEPQALRIRRRERTQDQTQEQWQDCTDAGVQGNMVAASTNGFSVFALYGTPKEPPVAASVTVSPATLELETGDVVSLTAQVLDAEGGVLDVPVTWSVDNPAVATVDATGRLTALTDGTTSVTATAEGKQGSAGVTVRRKVGSVVIGAVPAALIEGDAAQLTVEVFDPTGAPVPSPTVTWTSLNPGAVTVDATGKVTAVSAGQAPIVATSRDQADTAVVTVLRRVASVTIGSVPPELIAGESAQLVVEVRDGAGALITDPTVTWTSLTPAVVTVDASGKIVGVAAGSASIVAAAQQQADTATVVVSPAVASVTIEAASTELIEGESTQLSVDVRDPAGARMANAKVTWTSASPTVATVDGTGKVTGVSAGSTSIVAVSQRKADTVNVTVSAPPTTITITGNAQQALMPGATRQLSATATNASGQPVGVKLRWTSSNNAIATVSENGLVTAVARGLATISAGYGTLSSSVDVRVAGESGEAGNNLSWPVVFAEGTGLTGLAVAQDAGLRPTTDENIVVDARPFFYSGNSKDCAVGTVSYYCQQGANVWQAEWLDGSSGPPRSAEVKWGDNITHHTFGTHSVIHVEISLSDLDAGLLRGYNMTVISGSGSTEMQGTDGSIGQFVPTIFTGAARLIVEKLDDTDTTAAPILTLLDQGLWQKGDGPGQFSAEVTMSGKVVYGWNLKIQDLDTALFGSSHKYGWWRFTLVIGGAGAPRDNIMLRQIAPTSSEEEDEAPLYTPVVSADGRQTSLTIYINKDGGGGSH